MTLLAYFGCAVSDCPEAEPWTEGQVHSWLLNDSVGGGLKAPAYLTVENLSVTRRLVPSHGVGPWTTWAWTAQAHEQRSVEQNLCVSGPAQFKWCCSRVSCNSTWRLRSWIPRARTPAPPLSSYTSRCLSSLTWKMRLIVATTSEDCCEG